MSSFMYGRYTAQQAQAAQNHATVAVGQIRDGEFLYEEGGRLRRGRGAVGRNAEGPAQPATLNYAGKIGDKLLALLPAEALAFYTSVSTNGFMGANWNETAYCLLVVAAASAAFVAGRVTTGTYAEIAKFIKDRKRNDGARWTYIVAEFVRFLVPALAMIAWLMIGETDMIGAFPLPGWLTPGWLQPDITPLPIPGVALALVTLALAWWADRIGFNGPPLEAEPEPAADDQANLDIVPEAPQG